MVDKTEMPTYSDDLFSGAHASGITNTVDIVIEKAQKLASNSKFSDSHKAETIQTYLQDAIVDIEQGIEESRTKLNGFISKLESAGGYSVSPPVEEAAALMYTRDMIGHQWNKDNQDEINPVAIVEQWRNAVNTRDRVTARVIRDFAVPKIRNLARTDREAIEELAAQTEDLYLNDAQRKAREKLETYRGHLQELETAGRKVLFRLRSTRYQTGELVDASGVKLNRVGF